MSLSMKTLLIIGYGEYGHVVEELAADCGYEKIAALDDNACDALDTIDNIAKYKDEYDDFVVAIGNPKIRKNMAAKLGETYRLATLIHPTAVISKNAIIEPGCIIEPYAVIHRCAIVGEACIVNAGAVINHDSTVGACSHIGCNAVVGARAVVPECTKVEHCQWYM